MSIICQIWKHSHVKGVEEIRNPFDWPGYQLNILPVCNVNVMDSMNKWKIVNTEFAIFNAVAFGSVFTYLPNPPVFVSEVPP